MTENEAIEELKTKSCYECSYGCDSPVTCTCESCVIKDAVNIAIKALEKQIPKKIVNYNSISAAGNCPSCMKFIDSCDEYCRYCGQALKEDE